MMSKKPLNVRGIGISSPEDIPSHFRCRLMFGYAQQDLTTLFHNPKFSSLGGLPPDDGLDLFREWI